MLTKKHIKRITKCARGIFHPVRTAELKTEDAQTIPSVISHTQSSIIYLYNDTPSPKTLNTIKSNQST